MRMKKLLFAVLFMSCAPGKSVFNSGRHYQQHQDYTSLQQVVNKIKLGADTALVRSVLGEPIDMGFDYRYLIDSTGPNGCTIGAVFHIDEAGKIDQKWIGEICE